MNKKYIGVFALGAGVGVGGTLLFNKYAMPIIRKKKEEKLVKFEGGNIEMAEGSQGIYHPGSLNTETLDEIKKMAADYAAGNKTELPEPAETGETVDAHPCEMTPEFKHVLICNNDNYDYDVIEEVDVDEWLSEHPGVESVDLMFDSDNNRFIMMHNPDPIESIYDFGSRQQEIIELLLTSPTGKISVFISEIDMVFEVYGPDALDEYYEEIDDPDEDDE